MTEADANQSTQQYLNIISEQPSPIVKNPSLNIECSAKQSDGNRFTSESAGIYLGKIEGQPLHCQIIVDINFLLKESKRIVQQLKNKILN